MGPVISKESKRRVESLINAGVGEGAKPILDGRGTRILKYEAGNFLTPTILDGLPSTSQLAHTEIFGPVLRDRKSTRLNSSHGYISYAVFCLKKKNRFHT